MGYVSTVLFLLSPLSLPSNLQYVGGDCATVCSETVVDNSKLGLNMEALGSHSFDLMCMKLRSANMALFLFPMLFSKQLFRLVSTILSAYETVVLLDLHSGGVYPQFCVLYCRICRIVLLIFTAECSLNSGLPSLDLML